MAKLGVVVGRFQVPSLHKNHEWLLRLALDENDHVLIIVGSAGEYNTWKNPLPYEYRRRVLTAYAGTLKATVLPLRDRPGNDPAWIDALDDIITEHGVGAQVTMYGGPDSILNLHKRLSNAPQINYKHIAENSIHAVDIRANIGKMPIESASMANGVIWATQNQQVLPCVDIVCVGANNRVLVGQKSGESLWRFPGGVIDYTDQSPLIAAQREFREECGLNLEVADWRVIGAVRVDDARWPTRAVFSTVYRCSYVFGFPQAGDDLVNVQWMPISGLTKDTVMPVHHPILELI